MGQKKSIDKVILEKIEQINSFKKGGDNNDIYMGLESVINKITRNKSIIKDHYKIVGEYLSSLNTLEKEYLKPEEVKDKKIIKLIKSYNGLLDKILKNSKSKNNKKQDKDTRSPNMARSKSAATDSQEAKPTDKVIKSDSRFYADIANRTEAIVKKEIGPLNALLGSIENKVKVLKILDDKVIEIEKKTRVIKDALEDLDILPAKFDKLTAKFDTLNDVITNLDSGRVKDSKNNIPKDIQAIEELTQYMGDGLQDLGYVAKYYVSQQAQFEKNKKLKDGLDSEITKNKELSFKEGEKTSKATIAKEIYTMQPTYFNQLKSMFEDVLSEKYSENEKITTTLENLQELEVEIKNKLEVNVTYIVKTPAILIDNEVLIKAIVEESK